ncbi:hypothetical protein Ancab_035549 [Ancistrocladus abbreviatus]
MWQPKEQGKRANYGVAVHLKQARKEVDLNVGAMEAGEIRQDYRESVEEECPSQVQSTRIAQMSASGLGVVVVHDVECKDAWVWLMASINCTSRLVVRLDALKSCFAMLDSGVGQVFKWGEGFHPIRWSL